MTLTRSLIMAFACFSSIPMPQVEWDERNMRYMMAALPAVGACIGLCVWGWQAACGALSIGNLLRAAGLTLIPVALTGGIHMDGLADVIDAQSSHAEPERKRQILKDPHIGAFAAIGVGAYLIAYLALASELAVRLVPVLALAPVASRALAGLVVVTARPSSSKGMLATMQRTAQVTTVRVVLLLVLALTTGGMAYVSVPGALVSVAGALATTTWTARLARREYGGMSGDLVGFCLQVSELAMLAGLVAIGLVGL